jgi:hypothetical protein
MVNIPEIIPHEQSGMSGGTCLAAVDSSLRAWYETHRRFPTNELEFREAVEKGLVCLYTASDGQRAGMLRTEIRCHTRS